MNNAIYWLPLLLSAIAGVVSLLKQKGVASFISIISSVSTLACSILILKSSSFSDKYLYIDCVSKIMIFVIAAIYTTTVIYSVSYIKYIKEPLFHKNHYFTWMNFFALSMFFSVTVNNFGLLWVGIEATTVTSALLIAIDSHKESVEATWRYILIVSTGLILSLLGTILIFGEIHTLAISSSLYSHNSSKILLLGILLSIVGYGTKAGIFPMHTWLPDVHGKAPSPVSAIFSGVLLPVALFGILRVSSIAFSYQIKNFLFILGSLTLVVSALLMTVQKYFKRLYVYSSMENMGIALIGISLGGVALKGAFILIIAHAFAKSAVFYLSGNILIRYKDSKINKVKGLIKKMPFTAYCLFFAALAATGAPPFATFIGEIMIFSEVIKNYNWIITVVLSVFIAIAFISVNYYTAKMIFSGKDEDVKERKSLVNFVPLINIAMAFIIIFFIPIAEVSVF